MYLDCILLIKYFNPRTSCEVRPAYLDVFQEVKDISIHAPRVRCDSPLSPKKTDKKDFNPRTSCEVRRQALCLDNGIRHISIHAPRVRCDQVKHCTFWNSFISIHAPRVRCDGWLKSNDGTEESFQSTHLV